jgi:hypothetical protein
VLLGDGWDSFGPCPSVIVEPAHILLKGEGHMSVGRVSDCGLGTRGGSFRNVPKSVQAPTHVMLLIVEL